MQLSIQRHDATDGAILGELFRDGAFACFTLERQAVAIPPGTYQIRLTISQRATTGTLWTPDPEFRLPLLEDVPSRTGIRIHAGNVMGNSDGCILVGYEHAGDVITHSRQALVDMFGHINEAEQQNQPVTVTVLAPTDNPPRSV